MEPPPNKLYLYGITEKPYSEKIFTKSSMFFSSCIDFNDPFEGKPYIKRETNLDKLIEQHRDLMKRERGHMDEDASHRFTLDFINDKFSLNNAEKTWSFLDQDLISAISKVGMLCLSAVQNNVLMWSHYAAKHTGFCIEFDASPGNSFFSDARKVRYQESYPSIRAFEEIGHIDLESTQAALLSKSKDWAYEQEYRILMPRGPGSRPYPKERMRSVAFGCNMKQEHKEKIRNWVLQRDHPIKFFQASTNKQKYLVDFEEVF